MAANTGSGENAQNSSGHWIPIACWRDTERAEFIDDGAFLGDAATVDGKMFYVVSARGKLYRSLDSGGSWSEITSRQVGSDTFDDRIFRSVSISKVDGTTVYVICQNEILHESGAWGTFYTTGAGDEWKPHHPDHDVTSTPLSLAFGATVRLLAKNAVTIGVRSADKGKNDSNPGGIEVWTWQDDGTDVEEPVWRWGVQRGYLNRSDLLRKSDDQILGYNEEFAHPAMLAIASNGSVQFVSTNVEEGIFKRSNLGGTARFIEPDSPLVSQSNAITALSVTDDGTTVIGATSRRPLIISRNGGETWSEFEHSLYTLRNGGYTKFISQKPDGTPHYIGIVSAYGVDFFRWSTEPVESDFNELVAAYLAEKAKAADTLYLAVLEQKAIAERKRDQALADAQKVADAALAKALADAKAELDRQTAALKAECDQRIADQKTSYDQKITELKADAKTALDQSVADWTKMRDDAVAAIRADYEKKLADAAQLASARLEQTIRDWTARRDKAVADGEEATKAAVKKVVDQADQQESKLLAAFDVERTTLNDDLARTKANYTNSDLMWKMARDDDMVVALPLDMLTQTGGVDFSGHWNNFTLNSRDRQPDEPDSFTGLVNLHSPPLDVDEMANGLTVETMVGFDEQSAGLVLLSLHFVQQDGADGAVALEMGVENATRRQIFLRTTDGQFSYVSDENFYRSGELAAWVLTLTPREGDGVLFHPQIYSRAGRFQGHNKLSSWGSDGEIDSDIHIPLSARKLGIHLVHPGSSNAQFTIKNFRCYRRALSERARNAFIESSN